MRILDRAKIPYKCHTYDASDGHIDGVSVAEKMGQNPDFVYKTLVTQGNSRNYFVFVVPVAAELDLKAAARSVGEKSVEMIKVADINKVTGYIRGGCTPIGMKKQFKTVIHKTILDFDEIIISGGALGVQLFIAPKGLIDCVGAETHDIIFD